MGAEPLKGKSKDAGDVAYEQECLNKSRRIKGFKLKSFWFAKDDVCSAVEWLKDKMDNHRKSNMLWRLQEDESWSMAEDWIDEAFADVDGG